MTKRRLTAFCLAILTLAGCSQAMSDSTKPAADKPGAVRPQSPPYNPSSGFGGGGGGDGGGAGY
jgi:hypothetical protein